MESVAASPAAPLSSPASEAVLSSAALLVSAGAELSGAAELLPEPPPLQALVETSMAMASSAAAIFRFIDFILPKI